MPLGATEPLPGGSERGLTLVELLVAIVIALLVLVVPLTWIIVSSHQSNVATSRALSATQAESGLLQLTRDLREVSPGTTSTFTWGNSGASATFSIPTPGNPSTPQTVTWSCTFGSGGSCTRQVGTGQETPIRNVEKLTFAPADVNGNQLTSPATNPAYVGVTLQVQNTSALDRNGTQSASRNWIALTDGAYLRNSGS
jgi:prepilin-type N-terminal cleavage/methylation domain-containing protein